MQKLEGSFIIKEFYTVCVIYVYIKVLYGS